MNPNAIITSIRALYPDLHAVLAFAQELEGEVDPVVDAYLRAMVGFWRLDYAMRSECGQVRSVNEDGVMACPSDRVFAVFDGMGGTVSGQDATRVAIEAFETSFPRQIALDDPTPRPDLAAAMARASDSIHRLAERDVRYTGIAATSAAILIEGTHAQLAHIGECRILLARDGKVEQLTRDHTVANEAKDHGIEAQDYYANIVTRALGIPNSTRHEFEAALQLIAVHSGDRFLLCSDGLYKFVEDDTIARRLLHSPTALEACDALVDEALSKANDNITALVVDVHPPYL